MINLFGTTLGQLAVTLIAISMDATFSAEEGENMPLVTSPLASLNYSLM